MRWEEFTQFHQKELDRLSARLRERSWYPFDPSLRYYLVLSRPEVNNLGHVEVEGFVEVQVKNSVARVTCLEIHKDHLTETPRLTGVGSNMLASVLPESILEAVRLAQEEKWEWDPPQGYLDKNVSSKVIKILLGYLREDIK